MTTRTKLNLASFTASTMMLLNVFSRPLGLSEGVQWALILGAFVPLGLVMHYIKKLKEERARGDLSEARTLDASMDAQKKVKKRLLQSWLIAAAVGLATPLWLPITGVSRGVFSDCIVGIISVVVVSVIFAMRLKKGPTSR